MKSKFIIIAVISLVAVGIIYLNPIGGKNSTNNTATPQETPALLNNKEEINAPVLPQRLIIPKIGVNTFVESVGLDNQGRMDVPSTPNNVGWYNLGVKPGQKGNAVVDGHLDSEFGPAVFYSVPTLTKGDQITVIDQRGQQFTFEVTENQTYYFNQVPLEEIFGATDKTRLNLITCGGFFNNTTRNYSHRIVIYSELVESA